MFNRATPSVVPTTFTGYLPAAASATARSVFLPVPGRAPFEDLNLHRLATEQPLQVANALFKTADLRSRPRPHRRLARLPCRPPSPAGSTGTPGSARAHGGAQRS